MYLPNGFWAIPAWHSQSAPFNGDREVRIELFLVHGTGSPLQETMLFEDRPGEREQLAAIGIDASGAVPLETFEIAIFTILTDKHRDPDHGFFEVFDICDQVADVFQAIVRAETALSNFP
jgi:hypothetical protein